MVLVLVLVMLMVSLMMLVMLMAMTGQLPINDVRHKWAVRRPGRRRRVCTAAWEPVGNPASAPDDTPPLEHSGISAREPWEHNYRLYSVSLSTYALILYPFLFFQIVFN
jgi:hypothetical protein